MSKQPNNPQEPLPGRSSLEQALIDAQEIGHLGSWEWDVAANVVTWSDELYRIYGLEPQEFEATYEGFLERVHPNDLERVKDQIGSAYQTGRPFMFEHRIVRPDGKIRTLIARGRVILDNEAQPVRMSGTGHDITERMHLEQRLRLLQEIAAAANAATTVESALQATLDLVCDYTGWPIGHAYLVSDSDSGEQAPTALWHLDDPTGFSVFREVTEMTVMPRGIGLPGRVLESKKAAWIRDVMADPNFPRNRVAEDIGVRAAFGFPILVADEVGGVLEFFAEQALEPDEDLLKIMQTVGTYMGRVVERASAEGKLAGSEAKYRALADTAKDAIISANADGNIVYFNSAAEAMFGHVEHEVIDKPLTILMPERFVPLHLAGFSRYRDSGDARVIGKTVELAGKRRDGSEFPLELSLAEWGTDGTRYFTGIVRDISERKRVEEAERKVQDAQRRQQQALEIHDNLVQGLAVAQMALQLDEQALTRDVLEQTLASAKDIVKGLLTEIEEGGTKLGPGDFVRDAAATTSAGKDRESR
jgi:PAS domain S-box-containing protein